MNIFVAIVTLSACSIFFGCSSMQHENVSARSIATPTSQQPVPELKTNNSKIKPSAKEIITKFYEEYMGYVRSSKKPEPALKFSKSFENLWKKNREICNQFGEGVCGFGVSGDIYFDAQEYGSKMTLKETNFKAIEKKPGIVEVTLNVYPSAKSSYYDRKIEFMMIYEENEWVVDDINYFSKDHSQPRQSARVSMITENEAVIKEFHNQSK